MRTAVWRCDAIRPCQAVEQLEPHLDGELLAGERIEERLEEARESRRLDPAKAFDERPELPITAGEPIEAPQIHPEAERALEHRGHPESRVGREPSRSDRTDMESRASLLDGDLDRSAVQDQHPTVDVSIPAIDGVPGSTPRGPYGQVEPERQCRKDDELGAVPRYARRIHSYGRIEIMGGRCCAALTLP